MKETFEVRVKVPARVYEIAQQRLDEVGLKVGEYLRLRLVELCSVTDERLFDTIHQVDEWRGKQIVWVEKKIVNGRPVVVGREVIG